MRKRHTLVLAALIATLAISARPAAAQTRAAYDRALAEAKTQDRILLLDFYTDW